MHKRRRRGNRHVVLGLALGVGALALALTTVIDGGTGGERGAVPSAGLAEAESGAGAAALREPQLEPWPEEATATAQRASVAPVARDAREVVRAQASTLSAGEPVAPEALEPVLHLDFAHPRLEHVQLGGFELLVVEESRWGRRVDELLVEHERSGFLKLRKGALERVRLDGAGSVSLRTYPVPTRVVCGSKLQGIAGELALTAAPEGRRTLDLDRLWWLDLEVLDPAGEALEGSLSVRVELTPAEGRGWSEPARQTADGSAWVVILAPRSGVGLGASALTQVRAALGRGAPVELPIAEREIGRMGRAGPAVLQVVLARGARLEVGLSGTNGAALHGSTRAYAYPAGSEGLSSVADGVLFSPGEATQLFGRLGPGAKGAPTRWVSDELPGPGAYDVFVVRSGSSFVHGPYAVEAFPFTTPAAKVEWRAYTLPEPSWSARWRWVDGAGSPLDPKHWLVGVELVARPADGSREFRSSPVVRTSESGTARIECDLDSLPAGATVHLEFSLHANWSFTVSHDPAGSSAGWASVGDLPASGSLELGSVVVEFGEPEEG